MSDFASLLSQLDQSAKTKKPESKSNGRKNDNDEFRKRSQTSESERPKGPMSNSGARKATTKECQTTRRLPVNH